MTKDPRRRRAGEQDSGRDSPAPTAGADEVVEARSLAARIGARLRARRKELDLTLAETAERCGLSISYLSAVETGANLPSLLTLAKITEALETTIPTVVAEEGANRVRTGRLPLAGGGDAVELSHGELQLRAAALSSREGDESLLVLPTKDHDVFCYVLEGTLEVHLEGREPITLQQGDALDVRSAPSVAVVAKSAAVSVWTSCPVRL